jgi:hypothetical protein
MHVERQVGPRNHEERPPKLPMHTPRFNVFSMFSTMTPLTSSISARIADILSPPPAFDFAKYDCQEMNEEKKNQVCEGSVTLVERYFLCESNHVSANSAARRCKANVLGLSEAKKKEEEKGKADRAQERGRQDHAIPTEEEKNLTICRLMTGANSRLKA